MSVKTSQMTFNLLEGNNDLKIHIIVLQDLNALNKEKNPQSFLVCIPIHTACKITRYIKILLCSK